MAIFFSQGGPVVSANPKITKVCLYAVFQRIVPLDAVFQVPVQLKAVWHQCND